jgi:hypothetical protein
VNSWELKALDLDARLPEILSSSEEARVIVLDLAAGESLSGLDVAPLTPRSISRPSPRCPAALARECQARSRPRLPELIQTI